MAPKTERNACNDLFTHASSSLPVQKVEKVIENAHNSNIIAAKFVEMNGELCALSGAADKTLKLTSLESGNVLASSSSIGKAAVLSISVNPIDKELASVGFMDGRHSIINLNEFIMPKENDQPENFVVANFNDHSFKYVLNTKWSKDGKLLATCSRDCSVHIYKKSNTNEPEWTKVETLYFPETPESIEFTHVH
jgi:WD40 repeat protein